MNILAFDTCFSACSVAACRGYGQPEAGVHARFEPMEQGHAERLVPMIAEVLAKAEMEVSDLDRIAVTTGPGSFTGTRICVAAARALALSSKAQIVGLSSLAVMAEQAAQPQVGEEVCASLAIAVDARRGEVYVQHFETSRGATVTQPLLLSVDEAARIGGDGPITFAGSAAAIVAAVALEQGRRAVAIKPDLLPRAADMLALSARSGTTGGALAPLYMRPADAKPQTGKSIERA